jgi:L-lactate dehydrogenase (cytochrome)
MPRWSSVRASCDVANVNSAVEVLGATCPLPLVLAPTGFTRMMHHEGELAVGRAAAAAGVPYVLSTMGTTSVEDLATQVPDVQRWFQLYLWQVRARPS